MGTMAIIPQCGSAQLPSGYSKNVLELGDSIPSPEALSPRGQPVRPGVLPGVDKAGKLVLAGKAGCSPGHGQIARVLPSL